MFCWFPDALDILLVPGMLWFEQVCLFEAQLRLEASCFMSIINGFMSLDSAQRLPSFYFVAFSLSHTHKSMCAGSRQYIHLSVCDSSYINTSTS